MRKSRIIVWASLTFVAALTAFGVPLVSDATGILPDKMDDPEMVAVEPKPQGPEVLVASGTTPEGIEYRLTAYQSNEGICVNFTRSDVPELESGSCGFGLRGENNGPVNSGDRSMGPAIEGGPDGPWFVYGPATPDVQRVEITLKNGRVVNVPAKAAAAKEEAAAELGGEFRYFVATIPGPPSVPRIAEVDVRPAEGAPAPTELVVRSSVENVEARDTHGNVVGRFMPHNPS